MVKPIIKLRPKTQRIESEASALSVSTELTEKLQEISEHTKQTTNQPDLVYFRPKKKQISIRMDADVLAWFQGQPGKYQQLINKACRQFMEDQSDERNA